MSRVNRRRFLQLAGAGSVAAATAGATAIPSILSNAPRLTTASQTGTYAFRAVAGLPTHPLPSYASYVVAGHIDLSNKSGLVTKTVFAGDPASMSTVALPGLSRIIRITDVRRQGDELFIQGMIDDRSLLQKRESAAFTMYIDLTTGVARTDFFGSEIQLRLA
jgi:hypothetical protein